MQQERVTPAARSVPNDSIPDLHDDIEEPHHDHFPHPENFEDAVSIPSHQGFQHNTANSQEYNGLTLAPSTSSNYHHQEVDVHIKRGQSDQHVHWVTRKEQGAGSSDTGPQDHVAGTSRGQQSCKEDAKDEVRRALRHLEEVSLLSKVVL
jgi:hypothetical protein